MANQTTVGRRGVTRVEPQQLNPEFAGWIKRTRDARGLSTKDLADKAGLSTGVVQGLLNGEASALTPVHTYQRLALGLDLDLSYVMHRAGFDIGPGGINMQRLERVEAVVDRLDKAEPALRRALAEGAEALAHPPDAHVLGGASSAAIRQLLVEGLAHLDLITERLKEAK